MKRSFSNLVAFLFAMLPAACVFSSTDVDETVPADANAVAPDAGAPDPTVGTPDANEPFTGEKYEYVQRSLLVPTSGAERIEYGCNVDGDPAGSVDNKLGSILGFLVGQGFSVQPAIDGAIQDGSLVSLHRVVSDSLATDPAASWEVHLGDPAPTPPRFDGTDSFSVSSGAPPEVFAGPIAGGLYTSDPSVLTLSLPFMPGAPALSFHVVGARIITTAPLSPAAGVGKICGALTEEEIDAVLLPAFAALASGTLVSTGCTTSGAPPHCNCPSGTTAETLQSLFDANDNCMISAGELKSNVLLHSFLAPDVDLLNCASAPCDPVADYAPRTDGVKDSLSIGFKFELVKADF